MVSEPGPGVGPTRHTTVIGPILEEQPMEPSGFVDRPDYRVDILARRNRVTASVGGEVLADSERCLLVDEQDHGLVFYFPPEDVRLDLFVPDSRTTRCPFKGTATYRKYPDPKATCSSGHTRTPIPRWPDWPATSPSTRMPSTSRSVWPTLRSPGDERPPLRGAQVPPCPECSRSSMSNRQGTANSQESATGRPTCRRWQPTARPGHRRLLQDLPHHTARSAHAVFLRVVDDERPLRFDVDVIHEGRTFAGAVVSVLQGGPRCASVTVLMDVEHPDVIRHGATNAAGGPAHGRHPLPRCPWKGVSYGLTGYTIPRPRRVRPPHPRRVAPLLTVPQHPALAKALIAHFTGHLSISTTMRAHRGIGTSMAHDGLSTGVMAISVTFHEPVVWDGWLLYHHESSQAGSGMAFVRGQVFTEDG